MTHAAHVPADFVSTFRRRFAPLFGRKIGRQRSEQYLGGLLGGRAERRNVTALAGTVDGATARALGWLLNKSPWQTRPIVDALQKYVGDTFGEPEGLFTLNLDSFVKRGDNAVGVEKQYVHHLRRTQNCQIGVFLAYGSGEPSALVDAAIYMPNAWIENAPRREKAGVPASLEYQSRSVLALGLLRNAREAGHLPGGWVTSWHGEGFEADLRAGLDADGWCYLLPVSMKHQVFASADAAAARPVAEVVAGEAGGSPIVRRVWEGEDRQACWLLGCTDPLSGDPVAFVSNAPEGEAVDVFERVLATRWSTARMVAARCAGVSLDVYRVRGWDGWHRHVALALLASAFRACLPVAPEADAAGDHLLPFPEPVRLDPVDDAPAEAYVAVEDDADLIPFPPMAGPTTYHLVVDLEDSDWRAVRAYQTLLMAEEAGTVLESMPSRAEIERQEVGARLEIRFESEQSLEQIVAALDEVPEIVVAELVADVATGQDETAELEDADGLLAALEAELSARTTARESGLLPAFEGPVEVIGNAIAEVSRSLEQSQELVAAHAPNGHANGHANGSGALTVRSLGATIAPPGAPSVEAPIRPVPPVQTTDPKGGPDQAAAPASPPAKQADRKRAEEKARPAEEQMVILDVGDEAYGIPVQRVREIIRVPPITRVPNGPSFLEGVINLRGQVIPVLDLRKHLGIAAEDETRRSRVVVSELGRHTVGLMVDGVSEVVMVATTEIEPPPSLITGANDGQIRGVARLGDRLVLFLDPDRMLPNR